ncbi:unnamed protein product [Rhizophagus irregularis]|nr:unnamed protein product [Rhizophagus irregularis]
MFVFKCKERKPKKVQKVAWSEEDETHIKLSSSVPKHTLKLNRKFSPFQEALLVAAKILGELSDLTAKLIEELNYDFYWAVNETSKILSKIQRDSYNGDDLKDYDLGERDNSIEVDDTSSPVPPQHE